jgi:hypothetical protein
MKEDEIDSKPIVIQAQPTLTAQERKIVAQF